MSNETLIGLSEVDITPDFPTKLAGYNKEIERKCEGIHDKINAKAISIEKKSVRFVLLSVPSVGIPIDSVERIRSKTSGILNIPKQNMIIHATHSHSCPRPEGEYQTFLEDKCVECAKTSFEQRFNGKLGFGNVKVRDCGKNRRRLLYGGLPVDPEIVVMKVEDASGNLKAVLFNYACHCTVMGVDSRLISEDWPFFAHELIKSVKGGNVASIFIQGASGDINPGYSAGLSAVGAKIPIRNWDVARELGEKVGTAVLEALDGIAATEIRELALNTRLFTLPVRKKYPMTLEQALENYERARKNLEKIEEAKEANETVLDFAKMDLFFASLVKGGAEDFHGGKWSKNLAVEVVAVKLDDNAIATFPGEVFCEDGMKVKRASSATHTMIAELSNHIEADSYIPPAAAYAAGDYEVYCSRYAANAADVLTEESIKNLEELFSR